MTIEHLALISIGHIVLALTFVMGVMVGVSLQKRRDSQDGYEDEDAE